MTATTVNTQPLTIYLTDDKVMVNGADVDSDSGVVHAINAVLMPA